MPITSLMIGDEVIVEIDYGRSLNQQLQLELDKVITVSCQLGLSEVSGAFHVRFFKVTL